MTGLRWVQTAAVVLAIGLWVACGDYYRPVANPIIPNPPNPAFPHVIVVISGNGANNPGSGTTIDVSGDIAISAATLGLQPVHAALVSSATKVYAANRAENTVSEFSPSSPTPVITISLPAGSAPSFVASTEATNVYVANSASNTVAVISMAGNVLINTIAVGVQPVAMAELPNGQKLYVANQGSGSGNGSVSSINTIDQTLNPPIQAQSPATGNAVWVSPVWVASRSDGQTLFVLDSGAGTVSAIDTFTDAIVGSATVGVGADFLLYDPILNRVYVTNPTTSKVIALDASTNALTPLPSYAVANPVSVAALPDGSRVYVATATVSGAGAAQTVSSSVTVLNAQDMSLKTTVPLTSVNVRCATRTWSELFMASAADSSRVYVGNCDAGNTAILRTSNDTLLTSVAAPLSAQTPPNGGTPLPQNPVFVLAGP